MRHRFTHAVHQLENIVFRFPRAILAAILLVTVFFALKVPGLQIYTAFEDLLPQNHPYIQLHNEIRGSFGGASQIVVALEVEDGTIFTNETLSRLHRLTQAVDNLSSVNHNQVSSLAHRTVRKIWLTESGEMISRLYYDPTQPKLGIEELEALKNDVMANPRVYGLLVSPDLKSALIKAQLNEADDIDYGKTFAELQAVRAREAAEGVRIHATGNPVLIGWVYTYLPQIVQIFLYTLALMVALLVMYFRRLYGVLLPLLGIVVSSIWGLGFISLMGWNLDPLNLVIPFLIAARAMSHSIQLVERYYFELGRTNSSRQAARNAFDDLFRPGSLAIVVDAAGILVLALGAAPINTKMGYYAGFWAFTVVFTVLLVVPLLLLVLPQPRVRAERPSILRKLVVRVFGVVGHRSGSIAVLAGAAVLVTTGAWLSLGVQIGEAEPGSPLLYPQHDYNVSSRAINHSFPGSEELYIVARTADKGGLKNPEVLRAIESFQKTMLNDPNVGGTKALPGLIRSVNGLIHNTDPRWNQIPSDPNEIGGLMFTFMAASPIPGALNEYTNTDENLANVVFFYKDHQAQTIDRAIALAKEGIDAPSSKAPGLSIELAGGMIGVNAAINDAVRHDNFLIVPLVLALSFAFVWAFYGSLHAGWLMVLPMIFATVMTYAYMSVQHIGMNVNTVPVIAVGIGVGIDYAIYIMNRIREEMAVLQDLRRAVLKAIATTGFAVSFTAMTLIAGVVMWILLSDLRFQSDAALLLSLMLILNVVAAMLLVPAWVMIFKPRFITAVYLDEDEVLQIREPEPQGPSVALAQGA
ncbi:efflux RND transporter permease subunit [Aromatoleum buckelii]|uniref:MMPL family transporter n=1 Tax=Aromatoleum buckelii TaxID=200254 RepID=A0ABX1N3X7_9RHOO|nr:MMPL family transporter [Aromatoleum buckelii]MCK0511478.1 MMPL family transporter [Aromatoleum buckelii]